jgi:hypothetical protein
MAGQLRVPYGINSRLIGRVWICDGLAKAWVWISLVTQGLDGASVREAERSRAEVAFATARL